VVVAPDRSPHRSPGLDGVWIAVVLATLLGFGSIAARRLHAERGDFPIEMQVRGERDTR
jgi:hypothetical protein